MQKRIASSFRDPSGFLYMQENTLYRKINPSYKHEMDYFISSGLYSRLISDSMLIGHDKISEDVFKPEVVDFISYPYEWCFDQLKDAASLTLNIQDVCMRYGMTLKDASAFNIQFINGRPIFIDLLSFEKYIDGTPWSAYGQFCRHFLVPLALMCYKYDGLVKLFMQYIDGIPLDLAVKLLPVKCRLSELTFHIYMQNNFSNKNKIVSKHISRTAGLELIASLRRCIKGMRAKKYADYWSKYSGSVSYSDDSFASKEAINKKYMSMVSHNSILDVGAGSGAFSRMASELGGKIISIDNNYGSVSKNYSYNSKSVLPLVVDIVNPSPAIGWGNVERQSFIGRCKVDVVLANAIIHHLVIANNIPLEYVANLFATMCKYLVIEFVPKHDKKIITMLQNRKDIFEDYNETNFENIFLIKFNIISKERIVSSDRIMYLMETKK